ncbi:DNA-directed RNA polymerases IV and V subunit 2-like [Hordeum vulgare subsp. vulgare]|uniref:DNA-directed RNA polymerases IV and V subunit 2-like n=1 Tax=Hordeum vulgare subsp. vulgare TaxID=112509 RepID=UPI001B853658|nr:DNA-directed RNA polymerases IV and V subunit 2-like [Hordeum vulgare subsp. vulgare]
MEEPETNLGQQSPNGPDTEIDVTDFMVLDCDEEGKFYVKQDAKGEQQPFGGLSPMDVGLKGIPSVVDEGKVKSSSDPSAQVPIDFNSASLEKFCKEAARSFFTEKGLISHQINSYNDFISHELQELFDSLGEITVEPDYDPSKRVGDWRHAAVKFGRVELEKPMFWADNSDLDEQKLTLKPVHARLQKMTYSSKINIEMTVQVYTLNESDKSKTGKDPYIHKKLISSPETKWVTIGRLPVMVKSNLCWLYELQETECQFDYGGYFLIKGTEKAFIAEEGRCLSRIWVTDSPSWVASYLSQIKREKIYLKLVPSKENDGFHKVINMSFLGATMPIWIMFFALGVSSDKEAFDMIDIQDCDASLLNILSATIRQSDEQCEGFRGGGRARQYVDEYIRKTKLPPKESFDGYVGKYLFPGVSDNRCKALFLGYMMKCLLMAYCGRRKCDNKDDFRNKRLDLACQLLRRELWVHLVHATRRMAMVMQRHLSGDGDLQVLDHYVDASVITNGLNRAFSTGSWCHPHKYGRCSGIVATLRRTNPLQMMSDMRKTRQLSAYWGSAGDARYPNPSYWGKLCFMSTPDGEKCGFVKNLAASAVVSSVMRKPLIDLFVSCGMKKLDEVLVQEIGGTEKIFLNGDLVGVSAQPGEFVTNLRNMRRSKQIDPQVEIKRDKLDKEVRVFSDAGRILRPLLLVENLKSIAKPNGGSYSFQQLMDQNIIELIGAEEEEDIQCACGIKDLFSGDKKEGLLYYSHCELDPSFLLGLSCGIIPFVNHNSAKRVLMQAEKLSQQAIGYSPTNSQYRVDTLFHQMYYPQSPLFKTVLSDCLGKRGLTRPEYFNGQNAIVSVNVHQGFNQEDSLVFNRASLERGMFRTLHFKSYKAQIENKEVTRRLKHREKTEFGKTQSKKGRVDSLDIDGLPYVGASLQSGDIVIGKVSESGEDRSMKLMHTEKGMVEKVILSANDDGNNSAVVTLRQVRQPCVGDKFASMHGQKGVIGLLDSQENFPFTCQGIVPDIVINPHGFPTRQTPGQLLEAAFGKGIALGGTSRFATPFTTPSVDVITEQLHKAGFSRWGGESVLNGQNGERTKSLVFMGPTYYQRLTHMAEDKVKFRNTGPVHPLTRQPVVDRKRFGGVKFGEMERDCLLAHGATANLHERLFTLSDLSQLHICQVCERVANVVLRPAERGRKVHGPYCGFCKSTENILRIKVPYGAKLLYQELFSMGICLKFETEAS